MLVTNNLLVAIGINVEINTMESIELATVGRVNDCQMSEFLFYGELSLGDIFTHGKWLYNKFSYPANIYNNRRWALPSLKKRYKSCHWAVLSQKVTITP